MYKRTIRKKPVGSDLSRFAKITIAALNINDGGVGNTQSNQAAAMTSNGAPNDLLNNFNPLTIIVASPLIAQFIYPYLQRKGIKFGRIDRMIFGFCLATASGVIGAIIQYRVYETSPWYVD